MAERQGIRRRRKLEEDDESRFEEEYNVWLSDEP
jgi:hypothetical protein